MQFELLRLTSCAAATILDSFALLIAATTSAVSVDAGDIELEVELNEDEAKEDDEFLFNLYCDFLAFNSSRLISSGGCIIFDAVPVLVGGIVEDF